MSVSGGACCRGPFTPSCLYSSSLSPVFLGGVSPQECGPCCGGIVRKQQPGYHLHSQYTKIKIDSSYRKALCFILCEWNVSSYPLLGSLCAPHGKMKIHEAYLVWPEEFVWTSPLCFPSKQLHSLQAACSHFTQDNAQKKILLPMRASMQSHRLAACSHPITFPQTWESRDQSESSSSSCLPLDSQRRQPLQNAPLRIPQGVYHTCMMSRELRV